MTLILTSVLPATDTQGARIKARSTHYGTSAVVPWDSSVSGDELHALAVRALIVKLNTDKHAAFRGALDSFTMIGDAPGRSFTGYAFRADSSMSPRRVWDV